MLHLSLSKFLPNKSKRPSSIQISDAGHIGLELDICEFLDKRCSRSMELQTLVDDYWKRTQDSNMGIHGFLASWINDLPAYVKNNTGLPLALELLSEFETHGFLRGAGNDGEALLHNSQADRYNLLDVPLLHLAFGVGSRWFALLAFKDGSNLLEPLAVEVEDETRLFENENALVLPEGKFNHRFEFHQGEWFGVGAGTRPLDQYPVSRTPADRGQGKLYWDGARAYCPISGAPLQVQLLDKSMKSPSLGATA